MEGIINWDWTGGEVGLWYSLNKVVSWTPRKLRSWWALWNCCRLEQEDEVFVDQSMEAGCPEKGTWPWMQWLFSSEAILKRVDRQNWLHIHAIHIVTQDPTLSLALCCLCLEILDFWPRSPIFSSSTGRYTFCNQFCWQLRAAAQSITGVSPSALKWHLRDRPVFTTAHTLHGLNPLILRRKQNKLQSLTLKLVWGLQLKIIICLLIPLWGNMPPSDWWVSSWIGGTRHWSLLLVGWTFSSEWN